MPRPNFLSAYPEAFHRILADMEKEREVTLSLPNRKLAETLRFRWYSFQKALLTEANAAKEVSQKIRLQDCYSISKEYEATIDDSSPDGTCTLSFVPRVRSELHSLANAAYAHAEIKKSAEEELSEADSNADIHEISLEEFYEGMATDADADADTKESQS